MNESRIIVRSAFSKPYSMLEDLSLLPSRGAKILDYECCLRDVHELRLQKYLALGYSTSIDPFAFGINFVINEISKDMTFDFISMNYTLNNIESPIERVLKVKEALKCLEKDGTLMVSTNTKEYIKKHDFKSSWTPIGDGYTIPTSGKFITGISWLELSLMLMDIGLRIKLISLCPAIILATKSHTGQLKGEG